MERSEEKPKVPITALVAYAGGFILALAGAEVAISSLATSGLGETFTKGALAFVIGSTLGQAGLEQLQERANSNE